MNLQVLHLISSSSFFGAERLVVEICKYLQPRGVKMHIGVISRDDKLIDIFKCELGNRGIKLIRFNGYGKINLGTIAHISRYIAGNNIDIIHCHGCKSNFYAMLSIKKRKNKRPVILSTAHGWLYGTVREKIYHFFETLTLRQVDSVITVSPEVKAKLEQLGVTADPISVIDNGIDLEDKRFATSAKIARQALGISNGAFVVGNVARLIPEKAQRNILLAAAELRDIANLKLVFIGDGPERDPLARLAADLGLGEQLLLTGNRPDARSLYAAFDLFLLSSLHEGLPMALLEAMTVGVPVIATAVGAITKVICDGENGIIIGPNCKNEMKKAVRRLHRDPALAKQLARCARATVKKKFSSAQMAQVYYQKYYEVVHLQPWHGIL